MPLIECEFESEVLSAVIQSRWPRRVSPELQSHVDSCAICSDVVVVAGVIDSEQTQLRSEAVLPDAGRVWWLAQLRARRENQKTAARPITAAGLIAGACAAGLTGACFGATSAWFQDTLRWASSEISAIDLGSLLAEHSALALAMAAVLFLVPAAAWLAIRRD